MRTNRIQEEQSFALVGVGLATRDGTHRIVIRDGAVASVAPEPETRDRPGWIALPGMANLHAHADRAFTAPAQRPSSLADAIEMSTDARSRFTVGDVTARATRFFERSLAHGVTRVRTHTDVDPMVELRSMEALCALREAMAARIKVDVIAFSTAKNDLLAPAGRDRLKAAVEVGADFVGAGLNFSDDPVRAIAVLLDVAETYDVPVDVHMDEHLAPAKSLTPSLIEAVIARDLRGRVTLSHACVLAAQDRSDAARLIDGLARAEITVIALPETNLFLQDRGSGTPKQRGITLFHELASAGVKVRLGTDNVRDWFFPYGDGDMLDTAFVAAISAHLDDHEALLAALCDGRTQICAGDPADIVLVPAESLDDALARRPAGRVTIRSGKVVSGNLSAAHSAG